MIEVLNRQRKFALRPEVFRRQLEILAKKYKFQKPEVTLAFVGIKTMRRLNRNFRKIDRPTDVLSFSTPGKKIEGKPHLGDILICAPLVFKKCRREFQTLEAELLDLAVHGFLHLIGFDHGRGIEEEEIKIRRLLARKRKGSRP